MNKAKRVIAFMLMIVLLIIPQYTVSAETDYSVEDYLSAFFMFNDQGELVDYMEPSRSQNLKEFNGGKFARYAISVPQGYDEAVVLPVKINCKGTFSYLLKKDGEDSSLDYDLYSDPQCENYIYTKDGLAYINKAGTYYIRIFSSSLNEEGPTVIGAALVMLSGENAVLKNKKELLSCIADDSKPVYFKYVVPKTCRVAVSVNELTDLYSKITLCNAKKQKITETTYTNLLQDDSKVYYALKKGTYYFRVDGNKGIFLLKAVNTYFDSKGGTTKAKATSLKVNGAGKTSAILAESKTSKQTWYKFYNPKNQKMSLHFGQYFTSGDVKVSFYDQKGKKYGSDMTLYGKPGQTVPIRVYVKNYSTGAEYLPKGTYYIKIVKDDKTSCGTVKVSIKNKY